MEENTIQLGKSNVLKLGIRTYEGEDTGEYLELDLEDIELPLKLQEIGEDLKKNERDLRAKLLIIEKKEDHKGKKLMSANEEARVKVINEYFKKQAETYNKFLGENGVEKLLNGRKMGWTTFQEIDEIIDKYIAPKLDITMKNITDKIKSKYSVNKEGNTLE